MAGERLHPFCIAAFAQDVIIQRKAPTSLGFRRQQQTTVLRLKMILILRQILKFQKFSNLALVARHVETAVERDHAYRFLLARLGKDWLTTHAAAGREFPANPELAECTKTG